MGMWTIFSGLTPSPIRTSSWEVAQATVANVKRSSRRLWRAIQLARDAPLAAIWTERSVAWSATITGRWARIAPVPHRALDDLGPPREAREAGDRGDAAEACACLKRYNLDALVRERLEVHGVPVDAAERDFVSQRDQASGEVDQLILGSPCRIVCE